MEINKLITVVREKITKGVSIQHIEIEDKTFIHKKHKSHTDGKFHLKLIIKSIELSRINKIESTKKIYHILDEELKEYIHSIQILIS
jgi:BolA family transcriptional regulator, general stress-responsive regulator|tara:strand:+ start:206 stop:466 length:261 start_codon:yes stop_codon:yes gene_type:complete